MTKDIVGYIFFVVVGITILVLILGAILGLP